MKTPAISKETKEALETEVGFLNLHGYSTSGLSKDMMYYIYEDDMVKIMTSLAARVRELETEIQRLKTINQLM